jgi:hypothetical protein
MTFFVHPSSATICSLVSLVRYGWDQVWTESWWPAMYSDWTICGREMTREPTRKKVDVMFFSSR